MLRFQPRVSWFWPTVCCAFALAACAGGEQRDGNVNAAAAASPDGTPTNQYTTSQNAMSASPAAVDRGISGPIFRGDSRAEKSLTVPNGDPVQGKWSTVFDWPLIGIHSVLTPGGKVMSYGSTATGQQGASFIYDVWDPALGTANASHLTLPNSTSVDSFCSAQLLLPRGDIQTFGGDIVVNGATTNTANSNSLIFSSANNSLSLTNKMNRSRWYAGAVTLASGEVYVHGGLSGSQVPEIRGSDGKFRELTGLLDNNAATVFFPHMAVAPDGKVLVLAEQSVFKVDTSGNGTRSNFANLTTEAYGWQATGAVYAPGKMLLAGGGGSGNASKQTVLIDFNGATPMVSLGPAMKTGRIWGSATVLADGKVAITGGSAVANAMVDVGYTTELYDPVSNTITQGATAVRARLYHSSALLMPDATVLSIGGGAPGPETNLNGEIYFPPYLYKADGTPATRPTISNAPLVIEHSGQFIIQSVNAATTTRITMVKTGSATHGRNMDQRFFNVSFIRSGDDLVITMPNRLDMTPGHYMLFIFGADGVPSIAKIVRVNVNAFAAKAMTATAVATVNGPILFREFSGNAFKPWTNIGNSTVRAPWLANDATGEWLAVYAHDGNGKISQRYRRNGAWSAGWEDTGAQSYWPPAATAFRGQAWLGFIDWFHGVRLRPFDPVNGVGATWELGGNFVEGPAMVSGGDGLLYVFGRSADTAQVMFRAFNGGYWSAWQTIGNYPSGAMSAIATATGVRLTIRQTSDTAATITLANASAEPDWTWLAGSLSASPQSTATRTAETVFATASDGSTSYRVRSGTLWGDWTSLGGSAVESQAAMSTANGDVEVTVRNASNQLWSRAFNASGNSWGAWSQVVP